MAEVSESLPRCLVTLCTFNERENIEVLIPEIHTFLPAASILVVDDNSPDGTGDIADQMAAKDKRIHVLHRAGKLGLGTATAAAFQFGINNGYELLVNMDADFSHPPRFLPALVSVGREGRVAIGSRYVAGGDVVGWGPGRHFMSRSINAYARLVLGLRTKDNSGSFRCYPIAELRKVDWSHIAARGYAFQEEVLYRLKCEGARFEEVPITFEERRFGYSKISWKEAVSAARDLIRVRLRSTSRDG